MHTLHIEHRVEDFNAWKRNAFDADPLDRHRSGVRAHRISRAHADPNYVTIDLDFETMPEAEAMQSALQNLWQNPLVQIASQQARIVEVVEARTY